MIFLLASLLLNVRTSFHCELKVLTFTLMVNTSVCQYILFHTSTLWLAQLVRKIDNHERLNQVSFMRHFLSVEASKKHRYFHFSPEKRVFEPDELRWEKAINLKCQPPSSSKKHKITANRDVDVVVLS